MKFENNLKKLRKENKKTQQQIADVLNITQATYSNYEIGNTQMPYEILNKLANYYNSTVGFLLGIENNVERINLDKKTSKIPVLGTIPAGIPIEMVEDILDYEEIPSEWLKKGDFFGFKIQGDSMIPLFFNGDIAIMRKQSNCENGQFAIVSINGTECTFKKIIKQHNGITLQPLNPIYNPIFYTSEQIEQLPITILGIVVEIRRTIK